jgi:streptogrisin C
MRRGSWKLLLLALGLLAGVAPTARVATVDRAAPAGRATVEAEQLAQRRGLSLEEAARRLDRQQRAHALDDELRAALGGGYGGMWIDQADGGRLKIGVVSGTGAVRDRVARHGLAGVTDLVTVRHRLDHLEQAAEGIGKALVGSNRDASWPLRSGMATDRNAVELALPEGRPLTAAQRTFVERLRRRYGDAVWLTTYRHQGRFASCNPPNCDPPLRGGVHMYVSGFPDTNCTAGFMAKGRTTTSHRYVLTAAHCVLRQAGGKGAWYAPLRQRRGTQAGYTADVVRGVR